MANKRLIDANALWTDVMMLPHNGDMISSEEVEQAIKDAPTVDVAEVVHGRWIEDQVEGFSPFSGETYLLDVLQCSVCGEYFDVSEARNYCPNCGAKMDGGNEDG